jgi:hypothetical protein
MHFLESPHQLRTHDKFKVFFGVVTVLSPIGECSPPALGAILAFLRRVRQPLRQEATKSPIMQISAVVVLVSGRFCKARCGDRVIRCGLENLRRRLDLLYSSRHNLEITNEDGWVKVLVCLPTGMENGEGLARADC